MNTTLRELQELVDDAAQELPGGFHIKACALIKRLFDASVAKDGSDNESDDDERDEEMSDHESDDVSNATEERIVAHVNSLRVGTEEQKQYAADALANLAFYNANQAAIVAAGGIPPLVALVRDGTTEYQKRNAAGALTNLASQTANRAAIAAAGGIPPLVALVRDGSTEDQKENAANALRYIALHNAANKAEIAAEGGILPWRT